MEITNVRTALEVYKHIVCQINDNAYRFKRDGVTQEELFLKIEDIEQKMNISIWNWEDYVNDYGYKVNDIVTYQTSNAYYPASYDLSEYIFQRTGYTQVGWSTTSGNLVPLDDMYTPVQDTFLFAEWAPNTYKVVYNSNGGSGSMSMSIHTYDIAKNLTSCAFSKEGYAFAGWATSSNGGVEYSDEANIKNLTNTNGDTVTLYAVWEKTTPYTQIKKIDKNNYSVELFNVDSSCTVIFATYQEDKLVEVYPKIYSGNKVPFATTKEFDTIKVMAWSNLNNLKPICEVNTTIIE